MVTDGHCDVHCDVHYDGHCDGGRMFAVMFTDGRESSNTNGI